MYRYKFCFNRGVANTKVEEIVEYPKKLSEDELDKALIDWLCENVDHWAVDLQEELE